MNIRPRINRWTAARRNLLFEGGVLSSLVQPHFVVAGENVDQPIEGMPGIHQQSVDVLLQTVAEDLAHGLSAVMLFGVVASGHKDAHASHAYDPSSHLHRAVLELKAVHGDDLVVMTDVCLCAYTDHGHCGIIDDEGAVLNDVTLKRLAETALSHARAGADIVAPSAMMDGQVAAIRRALDENDLGLTAVLSYSAKYASGYYGPFRDAADGAPQFGDRRSHQMDPANAYEAERELDADVCEGADLLMVKPGLAYLDIVRRARVAYPNVPLAAYNVSGEYSMVKAAAERGWLDERAVVLETLLSFLRAGADLVITYHALDAARWLAEAAGSASGDHP